RSCRGWARASSTLARSNRSCPRRGTDTSVAREKTRPAGSVLPAGLVFSLATRLYPLAVGGDAPGCSPGPRRPVALLFCSHQFALFFCLVLAVYWSMPWHRVRVYFLLAASFYFYASWNHWLATLIVISTTVDFFLANGIEASTSSRRRKLLLTINIVGNLSLLCYFKYANFFLDSLKATLHAAGMSVAWRPLEVMLPIGISFY